MLAPSAPTLTAQWRSFAELAPLREQWRALAEHALEPNVFYEPAFALAAAPVFHPQAGALCVTTARGHLAGLIPLAVEQRRYGFSLPLLSVMVHPFGPLGTPLLARECAKAVIGTALDHLRYDEAMPRILRMPLLPDNGPFAAALECALRQRGLPFRQFNRHRRALLAPGDPRARYLDRAIGTKMRKEFRRLRRRLSDLGTLTHGQATAAPDVARMLEQFLALERKGWKGRAGSAAAQRADILAFMRQAVGELAREGKARADLLLLDDRPLAAIVSLRSGDTAWSWKIAYDEDFARYSPGVQAMLDLSQALLDDETLKRVDSCATPDHPMIDHLWRERLPLSDWMILLDPRARGQFATACLFEPCRGIALAAGRKLRDTLRRIRPARAASGG
jgi:CelD/BcsL family acetyltransferase involved in cellulose biosynthesis